MQAAESASAAGHAAGLSGGSRQGAGSCGWGAALAAMAAVHVISAVPAVLLCWLSGCSVSQGSRHEPGGGVLAAVIVILLSILAWRYVAGNWSNRCFGGTSQSRLSNASCCFNLDCFQFMLYSCQCCSGPIRQDCVRPRRQREGRSCSQREQQGSGAAADAAVGAESSGFVWMRLAAAESSCLHGAAAAGASFVPIERGAPFLPKL